MCPTPFPCIAHASDTRPYHHDHVPTFYLNGWNQPVIIYVFERVSSLVSWLAPSGPCTHVMHAAAAPVTFLGSLLCGVASVLVVCQMCRGDAASGKVLGSLPHRGVGTRGPGVQCWVPVLAAAAAAGPCVPTLGQEWLSGTLTQSGRASEAVQSLSCAAPRFGLRVVRTLSCKV